MRWYRTILALGLAAVLSAIVSCASENSGFEYLRLQVDGQPTLAITKKDVFIRGVVVYFHGADEDEFALTSDDARQSMTDHLVNAGFAVVASRAGGNAFTDPATLQNYRELGSMALQHYRIENMYFLAESQGSIAAINLLASSFTPVRGLAAIRPALDAGGEAGMWASQAGQGAPTLQKMTAPLALPAESLDGRSMRFYVNDDASPSESTRITEFEQRFGPTADISVVSCTDGGAESSCVQGEDIVKWFTALG